MTTPADPNAFNDDGTPRRRYEIEQLESGKPILRTSIGLLLASSFVLIKNLLFAEQAQTYAAPAAAKPAELPPVEDPDLLAEVGDLDGLDEVEEGEDPGVQKKIGSSSLLQKSEAASFDLDLDDRSHLNRRSSGLPSAGNDNESLYGAQPGSGISIFTPTEFATGGSGSGSGERDDQEDPDEDEEYDDEDEDDTPVRNRLPVVAAPVILSAAFANQPVSIALADLLRHSSDPDGDPLSVRALTPSSGTLVKRADGSFLFTPVQGDTSSVSFAYYVSDGKGLVRQNAVLDLLPPKDAPIIGTATGETIIGTPRSDVILALAGDDIVIGRESNDVIYGGDGDDRILGGDGDDVIYGEAGNDVIFAGPGRDTVFGGDGDDQIFGEEGADTLLGEAGDDTISGGDDNDTVAGGAGDDHLRGDAGKDLIEGEVGSDTIEGGEGDDVIVGGADHDTVSAGGGDDTVVALILDGDDSYDGGEGTDTYDLSSTTADSVVDLEAGRASSADIGEDQLVGFENIKAGSGDDVLVANALPNELSGGLGEDLFVFRSSMSIGQGQGYRDRILDFEVGDRIDLDEISREFADAFEDTFEDQGIKKFVLIREQDAFTKPGEMKLQYEPAEDGSTLKILAGNIDFDSDAEFELEFAGTHEVTDRDFYWHT